MFEATQLYIDQKGNFTFYRDSSHPLQQGEGAKCFTPPNQFFKPACLEVDTSKTIELLRDVVDALSSQESTLSLTHQKTSETVQFKGNAFFFLAGLEMDGTKERYTRWIQFGDGLRAEEIRDILFGGATHCFVGMDGSYQFFGQSQKLTDGYEERAFLDSKVHTLPEERPLFEGKANSRKEAIELVLNALENATLLCNEQRAVHCLSNQPFVFLSERQLVDKQFVAYRFWTEWKKGDTASGIDGRLVDKVMPNFFPQELTPQTTSTNSSKKVWAPLIILGSIFVAWQVARRLAKNSQ